MLKSAAALQQEGDLYVTRWESSHVCVQSVAHSISDDEEVDRTTTDVLSVEIASVVALQDAEAFANVSRLIQYNWR